MKQQRIGWHALGVVFLALVVGVLFLRKPGLGDDFTYWKTAFELQDHIANSWNATSFHALRWPVWGCCWLLMGILGPGLLSYYGVPLAFLCMGALIAFGFAQAFYQRVGLSWAAALLFLFNPLIDPVAYRPMPDLAEGIWGACVVALWLLQMRSERVAGKLGFGALAGILLFVAEANRFTGVLIIPMVGALTLLFFPRKIGWFLVIPIFAGLSYGVEAWVYHQWTGDWLTSVHANMAAKGKKGTESVPLWYLPFRFFDTLWKGSLLSPIYMLLAIGGGVFTWRERGRTGRIVIAWTVLLYLAYSCALQGFNPPRPMLRDADRFLGSMAIPMAVLIAGGLSGLLAFLGNLRPKAIQGTVGFLQQNGIRTGILCFVALVLLCSRPFFDMDYVPKFREYLRSRPPGTTVFTQRTTRSMAFMMDPAAARRLKWNHKFSIIAESEELQQLNAQSDEFWYTRKLLWLRPRQKVLYGGETQPIDIASYFTAPESQWRLAKVLDISTNPEFVFYQKRKPSDPPARILEANDPVWKGALPPLPLEWDGKNRNLSKVIPVPEALRGKRVRVQIEGASNVFQPALARGAFLRGDKLVKNIEFKPSMFSKPAPDFFAFEIPADAESFRLDLQIEKPVKSLRVVSLRVFAD